MLYTRRSNADQSQNEPLIFIPKCAGKMIADHHKQHGQRKVIIVYGPPQCILPLCPIRRLALPGGVHHCLLRWDNDEEYIRHHDTADHCAKMNECRPPAKHMTIEISKTYQEDSAD